MQNDNSKLKNKKNLKNAVDFHGHLGPYLVLGLLIGDLAVKKLNCKRHFGIEAIVKGAVNKPKSCLIDGIQISSGCTYGKGNIKKLNGNRISVLFQNLKNNNKIEFCLKNNLVHKLDTLKSRSGSENLARALLRINPEELFNLKF